MVTPVSQLNDSDQHHRDGDDQEDMNDATQRVASQQSQQPENSLRFVMPDFIPHPEAAWIPAFAGMTGYWTTMRRVIIRVFHVS